MTYRDHEIAHSKDAGCWVARKDGEAVVIAHTKAEVKKRLDQMLAPPAESDRYAANGE